jgi:hypothetical protein
MLTHYVEQQGVEEIGRFLGRGAGDQRGRRLGSKRLGLITRRFGALIHDATTHSWPQPARFGLRLP